MFILPPFRYESTIAGQFFGHTHNDHYQMFYDVTDVTNTDSDQQDTTGRDVTGQKYGNQQQQQRLDDVTVQNGGRKKLRPIGVAFIGPSVTTHTNLNPGYRIYTVDGARRHTTRVS